jgi:hypothetical protein
MSSAAPSPLAPEEIARDATWLAQALDPTEGLVRLIAMDRESYKAAAFLDDRMLQTTVDAQLISWPMIEDAMAGDLRSDARWIFHIGHVGSTLVSRLLGELPNVLAIREPRFLRDLALIPIEVGARYIAAAPKLMSRTFADEEIACVKATSFASEIAPELVPPGERALFMYAAPANYVASILAGENSLKELRMLAPSRAQRLARRVAALGPAHGDAQLAAIAWACEMTALEAAADAMSDRQVEWADFDAMLDDMAAELGRIAASFGFATEPDQLAGIAGGPLMARYSKALEHEYSPQLRRDLIAQATTADSAEIDRALAMLRSAAEKSPMLARALARAEG